MSTTPSDHNLITDFHGSITPEHIAVDWPTQPGQRPFQRVSVGPVDQGPAFCHAIDGEKLMMKTTNLLVLAASLTTLAAPLLAESHAVDYSTLTCAEFMAMESEPMMMAAEGLDMAMHDGVASDPAMMEESMAAMATACEGMDDMTVMAAMEAAM
jgi:hypothetical protein